MSQPQCPYEDTCITFFSRSFREWLWKRHISYSLYSYFVIFIIDWEDTKHVSEDNTVQNWILSYSELRLYFCPGDKLHGIVVRQYMALSWVETTKSYMRCPVDWAERNICLEMGLCKSGPNFKIIARVQALGEHLTFLTATRSAHLPHGCSHTNCRWDNVLHWRCHLG